MTRALRIVGWTLIGLGVLIVLYLVYLMFFTNLETQAAQDELLEQWQIDYGEVDAAVPGEPADVPAPVSDPAAVDPGDAYAVLWFERPGSDEPLVHDEQLYVVEGVSLPTLRAGPGHYPDTAAPGGAGNFAVSGHRTTYGAPFYHLDDVQPGDLVHVVDRQQRRWTYAVREQRIVEPTALWVIGPDPLRTGAPTLTLTTCHPRFSAAQRLVVFAELVET